MFGDELAEIGRIKKYVKKSHETTSCPDEYIECDSFNATCMSNEGIELDEVVKLFDQDRKRWLLERIFTPLSFRLARDETQKLATASSVNTLASLQATSSQETVQSTSTQGEEDISKIAGSRKTMEEEWEEQRRSMKILKELQQELIALKDGEGDIKAFVKSMGPLQREVAAMGILQAKSDAMHMEVTQLQSEHAAILQRQEVVEETAKKLLHHEALLKQLPLDQALVCLKNQESTIQNLCERLNQLEPLVLRLEQYGLEAPFSSASAVVEKKEPATARERSQVRQRFRNSLRPMPNEAMDGVTLGSSLEPHFREVPA